jgi:hypothetical protein
MMRLRIHQETLGLNKLHLRWVPHALLVHQKSAMFVAP